jgi:lipid-A-disaccharide synthase
MDKQVVTELIQDDCNPKRIKEELAKLLEINHRNHVLVEYDILESKLGGIGASQKTAQLIVKEIL